MNYPLNISFKLLALASQMSMTDAGGNLIFYIKQKMFKLKEAVNVFADTEQSRQLFSINADRVLDFSARYHFTDTTGRSLGSIKREGMRSIWKANYTIFEGENPVMKVNEENAWIKVFDSLLGEVPILGMFTGYLFHPAYLVTNNSGALLLRVEKQPAFFEGKFKIDKKADLPQDDENRALLGIAMMLLLERSRG